MTASAVEVATRGFEAYNRGDYEALFELLAEDVRVVVSRRLPNEGAYYGREGFREMVDGWNEAWESFRIEPREVVEEGPWVIVAAHQSGRGRGSGVTVDGEIAFMFRARGERIAELRVCDSLDEALGYARES